MKKLVFTAILLSVFQLAHAQFDLGPKVGFTSSTLTVDQDSIQNGFRNNFLFGVFARIGNKVHLQPEIIWYTKGTVFKPVDLNSPLPVEQEITLSGIEIPLQLGFNLIDLELLNLRVFGGPAANFIVNKQIKTNQGGSFTNPIKENDIKDIHWGLKLGAGLDVLMFAVDVKYSIGLNNVIGAVNIGGNPVQFDSRSQAFEVSIGWKIL
ncbi:MAG TPA: porin family protein [Bacteroidales bacterium]|nr:porin family protein [Bacteroidales bacterium]